MSSAALTNCAVITAIAGIPRRSAVTASCKLHDEQLPQSPIPVTTASQLPISATICGSAGALKFDLTRVTTSATANSARRMCSRWAKKLFVPSLPFEMNPTVFSASVSRRGAGSPSGGAVSFVGSSTRKIIPVSPASLLNQKTIHPGGVSRPNYSDRPPVFSPLPIAGGPEAQPSPGWFRKSGQRPDSVAHLPEEPGGGIGPQSMQTPIGSVTARLLWPSQGGITAPKPPAGPPAAITRRSSGESSAVYSLSPRSRTTAPLPTSAHSRRKILAAGDECGDVGFAPTRCLQVFAQLAR